MKTKLVKYRNWHLLDNPEVKRIVSNARKTAKEDGYGQVIYEDEPGSVAYCRACLFGSWDYQTEDKIIAKIEIVYGS
jgi:hypothetical protein